MEYRRFKDTLFIRMDKGEEILEQLEKVCTAERVKLAQVSAIGAINEFTVGVLRTAEKQYKANNFTGDHEIVSLTAPSPPRRARSTPICIWPPATRPAPWWAAT